MKLRDKVAFITGGASGIGKGAALALAGEGARVAIFDRAEEHIAQAEDDLRNAGAAWMILRGEVSDSQAVRAAIERTVEEWGRLDIVVANAGINGVWAPVDELREDEWQETLAVNLTGTFLTVKHAVPHLKKRGGSIVITSSVNGNTIFSNSGASAYSASKAGQVAFAKMIALELAPHRIRVNAILPGSIDTNIGKNSKHRHLAEARVRAHFPDGHIPLTRDRPGRPEQVGKLIAFLAGDESDHITGDVIAIDGAQSLLQG